MRYISISGGNKTEVYKIETRPGVDKVKPKGWFKDSLQIDHGVVWDHHVLVCMGDLHLVHPVLNFSTLDAGILELVQQVSFMMFSLNMVDYPMSFLLLSSLNFFGGQVEGTILRCSYSLSLVVGPLLHA